jgi:hypothetical protein
MDFSASIVEERMEVMNFTTEASVRLLTGWPLTGWSVAVTSLSCGGGRIKE